MGPNKRGRRPIYDNKIVFTLFLLMAALDLTYDLMVAEIGKGCLQELPGSTSFPVAAPWTEECCGWIKNTSAGLKFVWFAEFSRIFEPDATCIDCKGKTTYNTLCSSIPNYFALLLCLCISTVCASIHVTTAKVSISIMMAVNSIPSDKFCVPNSYPAKTPNGVSREYSAAVMNFL